MQAGMQRNWRFLAVAVAFLWHSRALFIAAAVLDVREHGAAGDATDTAAIQKAIDAPRSRLGMVLGPGRYLSGTLFLKSRVRCTEVPGWQHALRIT